MKLTVNIEVEEQRITDLVTSALEGGSNYWYLLETSKSDKSDLVFWGDVPMNGGFLHITLLADDGPINGKHEWRLDKEACIKGIAIMVQKYPRHFTNWLEGNDDAETGDIFLQCALFGEIVFG